MKSFMSLLVIAPSVLGGHIMRRAACNADNCARAVTGTVASQSQSRVQTDCSSFVALTVCPTSTSTTTITSGSVPTLITPAACQTTATALPAYALTACTAGAGPLSRFSSACSCAKVTRSTTTATPVATQVVPTGAPAPAGIYCIPDNPTVCNDGRSDYFLQPNMVGITSFNLAPGGYTTDNLQQCVDSCGATSGCIGITYRPYGVGHEGSCVELSDLIDTYAQDGAVLALKSQQK